jgi:hypothetical protein
MRRVGFLEDLDGGDDMTVHVLAAESPCPDRLLLDQLPNRHLPAKWSYTKRPLSPAPGSGRGVPERARGGAVGAAEFGLIL